jgi:TIR domain
VASHDTKGLISNPNVFISYAWSEIRREMVLDIGSRLLQDGVDVVLDLWGLKEGDDRFHFMERSVSDTSVTKVLVFSDRLYSEKANRQDEISLDEIERITI